MANAYSPTFSTLIAEIQDICEDTNPEFVGNVPKFIWRAQDQVQRDLRLDLWRTYQTTPPITVASYTRSADWLIVKSIYLPTQNKFVLKRHIDYVRAYGGTAGRPRVWAEDEETTILFAPAPDISYNVRIDTYARLAALAVSSNETNWLTRNAGDLLLLQALINAASYLVNPEKGAQYQGMYGAVLGAAVAELRESERQRDQPIRAAPRPALPGASG